MTSSGRTVQVIPHVTDEIKDRIRRLADEDVDIVIVEIGGTVGDIEIVPFIEAIRQFRRDIGRDNVCYVHLTLVPFLVSGEQKTKPTQHSVTELRSRGIQPDVIVCRSDKPIPESLKRKISLQCDVAIDAVISAVDAAKHLRDPARPPRAGARLLRLPHARHRRVGPPHRHLRMGGARRPGRVTDAARARWASSASTSTCPTPTCRSSRPCATPGFHHGAEVELDWIDAELVPDLLGTDRLRGLDAIVIPGGFGERGIEGMVAAAGYQPRPRHPVPGPVPRTARDGRLGGPRPGRARAGQLARVRQPLAAHGDRPHARPGGGDGEGRDDAAGLVPGRAAGGLQGGRGPTAPWA